MDFRTGPAAKASAARMVALLAHMTEFFRGSRVVDFSPLFQLAARLSDRHVALPDQDTPPAAPSQTGKQSSADDQGTARQGLPDLDSGDPTPLEPDEDDPISAAYGGWGPGLPDQAMRLCLAIVHAHGKAVGASGGAAALAVGSRVWAPALSKCDVNLAMRFVRGAVHAPSGAPAQAIGPQLLAALARALVGAERNAGNVAAEERGRDRTVAPLTKSDTVSAVPDGRSSEEGDISGTRGGRSARREAGAVEDSAFLLLGDLCCVLRPEVRGPGHVTTRVVTSNETFCQRFRERNVNVLVWFSPMTCRLSPLACGYCSTLHEALGSMLVAGGASPPLFFLGREGLG